MNFDRLAATYVWLETAFFGSALWRCRTHFLSELGNIRCAILLGDGDGRFTLAFHCRFSDASLCYVDHSLTMKETAENRLRPSLESGAKITFLQADIRKGLHKINLPSSPDLFVAHFLFDCLEPAESRQLAEDVADRCVVGSVWLISEFAEPPASPMRWIGNLVIQGLYFFARLLVGLRVRRIPDYETDLASAGFKRTGLHSLMFGLLRTELWRFMGRESAEINDPPIPVNSKMV